MRRRKWLAALAVGMVALVTTGAFVLRPQPSRVTRENAGRIQKGMTRTEIEAILGPPGDYSTGPTNSVRQHLMYTNVMANDRRVERTFGNDPSEWRGDALSVFVEFEGSKAYYVEASSNELVEQNRVDNLIWRAKRQWREWFPE
jgi:hypothetical protein